VVRFPNAGHFVADEEPEALIAELRQAAWFTEG
jgi:pimeloyl-ACP methyl ester carboxylesterase